MFMPAKATSFATHVPTLVLRLKSYFYTVPPQILPFEFGDEPANAGDMASISCALSKGDQPLNISWVLNGQIIPKNNDMGIVLTVINKKTSILNIDSVSGIHRGTYLCVATNMAGSVNHSAVLEVNGTHPNNVQLAFFCYVVCIIPKIQTHIK